MQEIEKEHNILSKRLNKIVDSRIEDDQETLEALKELSTFYHDNSLPARRNLRSQIEKRSLDINRNFLSAFLEVKVAFDEVYECIDNMSLCMQDMTARLQNTKLHTKELLQKTSILQDDLERNSMQQVVTSTMTASFQLTPEELVILHGKKNQLDSPVSHEIFVILNKVQAIHNRCKLLMQAGMQTLAVEIMEEMTLHKERALERLYRWTQMHCRNVDNPDLRDIICCAMEKLQDRPVLFKYIVEEYSNCRRNYIMDEFINALTRGGTSGNPAPIELRAHDTQIYITDMLVWLNKAIPLEKQNLDLLVQKCNRDELTELFDKSLASICEGICQPLRTRLEKILATVNQPSVLYSVVNLFRYYKKCMCKVVKGGLLEETLTEFQEKSEKVFLESLTKQVNSLLVRVEAPPRDLIPTSSISHLLAILRDMLSTASMSEGREVDMIKIANCILEPLLRAVNEQASRLPPTDMAVYLLNCMYSMYTCLSLYEFMDERLERLEAQSDAQLDTLTSEQASSLVANLSLGPIYMILQDRINEPLSGIPGMEPNNLKTFLNKFNYLISSPDSVLLPQINLLSSSKHKKVVQKRAYEVVLAIYKQLYEAVHDETNLYEHPEIILDKSPDDLAKMLV